MKKLLLFIVLFVVSGIAIDAQTAWSSHTQANDDVYFVEHQFIGKIKGTDSLYTLSIPITQYEKTYTISYYWTALGSHAKVTVKRLDSWFANKWTVTKTLLTGDSTTTSTTISDTINQHPAGTKLLLHGYGTNDSAEVHIIIRLKVYFRSDNWNKQKLMIPFARDWVINNSNDSDIQLKYSCIEEPIIYTYSKDWLISKGFTAHTVFRTCGQRTTPNGGQDL